MSTFLRNTERWLDREVSRMDFEAMYANKDDSDDVLMADVETVNRILQKMRKLKLGINKAL
jgi:hypothetical protein